MPGTEWVGGGIVSEAGGVSAPVEPTVKGQGRGIRNNNSDVSSSKGTGQEQKWSLSLNLKDQGGGN